MEEEFHGTPSGVDHTASAHGAPLLYRRPAPGRPGRARQVRIGARVKLVVALVGTAPANAGDGGRARAGAQPAGPRATAGCSTRWAGSRARARPRSKTGDLESLGDVMNVNHGLARGAGVCSPRARRVVHRLRRAGALGAKLTGAGGDGGAVIGLFRKPEPAVAKLEQAGLAVLHQPARGPRAL